MLPIIIKGGIMMGPLVFCSLAAAAIAFERFMAYRRVTVDSTALVREILAYLRNNQLHKAIDLCANTPGPVSATVLVGLTRYRRLLNAGKDAATIEAQVTKGMADFGPHVIEVLERRLWLLSLIATIAPLLGMCGTVTGMINGFGAIVQAGQMSPEVVAGGIAEALITTAAGLMIAIPTVLVYGIFTRKVERFMLEIEDAAAKLVEYMTIKD